jgi:hypothetical protein
MTDARRRRVGRAGISVAGGAALVLALPPLLEKVGAQLNFTAAAYIALLAGTTGILLFAGGLAEIRRARAEEREQADELDDALACWPPLSFRQMDPYDLGVRPTVAATEADGAGKLPAYVGRSADADVDEAFGRSRLLVITGHAGAGKTRTALEALRRHVPDALVVYPENAQGLNAVLHAGLAQVLSDRRHRSQTPEHVVLWLDDLDRFLSGLQLDALDRFQRPLLLHGWRDLLTDAAAKLHLRRSNSSEPARVTAVGTLSIEAAVKTLQAGGDEAHVLRRLLARSRRITVSENGTSDTPAAQTLWRALRRTNGFGITYPIAPQKPSWPAGGPARASGELVNAGRTVRIDAVAGLSIALCAAILLSLLAVSGRVTSAAPGPALDDQVRDIAEKATRCGKVELSPSSTRIEVVKDAREVVAITHNSAGCSQSDLVRLFPVRKDALAKPTAFQLAPGVSPQRFACIGPAPNDPCRMDISAGSRTIVGAYQDVITRQQLPVAIYSDDDGEYRMTTFALEPPRAVAARLRHAEVSLPFVNDEPTTIPPGGVPVAAVALVPAVAESTATLVAAWVSRGTLEEPRTLEVQAYRLRFFGRRPGVVQRCRVGRRPVTVAVRPGDDLRVRIRRAWVNSTLVTPARCRPVAHPTAMPSAKI